MTKLYSYDIEGLTQIANHTLINVLTALSKEGYLSKDQVTEIGTNYSVIIETKRWLPKFLSKWLNLDDDHLSVRLCKAINREPGQLKE